MKENIQSIQFLRFVAAALVVAFHAIQAIAKYYENSISAGVSYIAGFGASGVHIFFVISGFVMVYTSFATPQASFARPRFFTRRFIRIYPIYWIYATVYLLFHNIAGAGYALTPAQILGAYLLLPGDSALIIGPGWTLSFEIFFYLCFGLAMVLGLNRGLIILTCFFIMLVALRYVLKIDIDWRYLHVFTNSLLLEFLLGAWVAYLVVHKTRMGNALANALLISGVLLFAAGLIYGYTRLPTVVIWGIPSALVVAGFVFCERNGQVPALVSRLSWLGDSSYSLYLLHILLIDIVLMALVAIVPMLQSVYAISLVFVLLLALNVAIAAGLYVVLERRLVTALQGLVKTRFSWLMGAKQPV